VIPATPALTEDLVTSGAPSRRIGRILAPAAVLLVAGLVLHAVYSREWGADDAYIAFRYAKNLGDGRGLVFNAGERVEGYTNFLFVVLVSLAAKVSHLAHYPVAVAINVAATVAVLVLFVRHVDRTIGREAARWAAAFVVLCPVLYRWVAEALETPVVLSLQVLLWVLAEAAAGEAPAPRDATSDARREDRRRAGRLLVLCLAAAGAVLVRADGIVFPMVVAAYLLVQARRGEALAIAATAVGTLGAHLAWRLAYYGYPLPNTFYTKVSGPLFQRIVHGAGDLAELGVRSCLLPPVIAIGWATIAATREARRRPTTGLELLRAIPFEAWMAGALLPFWVFVGGDVYEERFLLVLYPAGFAALLRATAPSPARVRAGLAALFIGLQMIVGVRFDHTTLPKYDQFLTLGEFLRAHHPASESIAIDGAGKVPYVTDMPTVDILGLNDLYLGHKATAFFVVGHNKYDADYVMRRRPNLIAAWLDMGATAIDLDWGLHQTLYAKNGYRVRYLLNTEQDSNGRDVVDVSGFADPDLRALSRRGYHYAVLERPAGP
jgi:arabinofuranosyltransferase